MATIEELRAATAEALRTNLENLAPRLKGLELGPVCGRCLGSGRYSYNAMHGTVCYGCNGARYVDPKRKGQWEAVLADALVIAADGRLDAYLAYLKARQVAGRAEKATLKAWTATGIGKAYDWRKSYGEDARPEDVRISNLNKRMSVAYEAVCAAARKARKVEGDKSATSAAERQALVQAVVDAYQAAKVTIAEAAAEMHGAQHSPALPEQGPGNAPALARKEA
jgi:hypothetical protein